MQAKTPEERKAKGKTCASCSHRLSPDWKKPLCQKCLDKMVAKESQGFLKDLLNSFKKEIQSTMAPLRSAIEKLETPASVAQASIPSTSGTHIPRENKVQAEQEVDSGESEQSESEDGICSDSEEEDDTTDCNLFPSEDTDSLLKAITDTLGIKEQKTAELTMHDRMYKGLQPKKPRTFPVHQTLKDIVKKEWEDPEKKLFIPATIKRRYPFAEADTKTWAKCPKVDASLAKITNKSDLAFDEAGTLSDPMDKKIEALLKRAWEAGAANLNPAIASTCTARTLLIWLTQLQDLLENDTPREELIKTIPTLTRAAAFLADASAETVRISSRTTALLNSARRALWLKSWGGDAPSKNRLCGIPFTGDLLFGPELETVLYRTAAKNKGFPQTKKRQGKAPFRHFKKFNKPGAKKHWGQQNKKGKGEFILKPNTQKNKKQ